MPGPEFFQTGMGRKFYDADVPRLIAAAERIATALETIVESLESLDRFAKDGGPEC